MKEIKGEKKIFEEQWPIIQQNKKLCNTSDKKGS